MHTAAGEYSKLFNADAGFPLYQKWHEDMHLPIHQTVSFPFTTNELTDCLRKIPQSLTSVQN